ncbi:hypothetical protein J7E62_02745 [Variovorax paradoxus]|nr:hypothetical protein [Variovorax paradoxus]
MNLVKLKARWASFKLHWNVARRKYTVWLATAAVLAPGALQWASENMALLGIFTKIDADTREYIRMVLVALIPIASALPQQSVADARAALEAAQAAAKAGA